MGCDGRSEAADAGSPGSDRYRGDRGPGIGASSAARRLSHIRQTLLMVTFLNVVAVLAAIVGAIAIVLFFLGGRE